MSDDVKVEPTEEEVLPDTSSEPVLSPEAIAEAALKARVALLQDKIESVVQDLIKNTDFTVEEFGYATDLFKGWVTILTHSTQQYEALVQTNSEAQNKYMATKLNDLISVRTPDEKTTEATTAVGSPEGV